MPADGTFTALVKEDAEDPTEDLGDYQDIQNEEYRENLLLIDVSFV